MHVCSRARAPLTSADRQLVCAALGHTASEGNRHKRSGSKGTAADSDPARSDSPAADGETALRHAFHRLPRYDVEVVTRCIVYFGIGYLAVFGIPVIFANVGLAPPA